MRITREGSLALSFLFFFVSTLAGCIDGNRIEEGEPEDDASDQKRDASTFRDTGSPGTVTPWTDTSDESSPDTGTPSSDAGTDTSSSCGRGKESCGGSCVDTSSSDQHCGGCGNPCPSTASCSMGSCECPNAGTICDDQCVDTQTDDDYCGGCNTSCSGPRSCKSGSCECPSGETYCNGSCVDTSSNSNHCGRCGHSCAGSEVCSSGSCAPKKKAANVISETNKIRSTQTDCGQYGVMSSAPALTGDSNLHQAAQKHSEDMATNDFLSHTGSDGSDFTERARAAGFTGTPIAENVAAGNSTASATVGQWKGSDGHCRNMMLQKPNVIGVGVARGGSYGWYWTQVFGRK